MQKNDPTGFRRLQGEVDKMFLELLGSERMPRYGKPCLRPNTDVYFDRLAQAVVVKLELAGVDPAKVALEIEDGVLAVRGARVDKRHPEAVYQQMEIDYGRFERLVSLPPDADAGRASAAYNDGFLEIVIPMKPRSSSTRIPISTRDDCVPEEEGGPQP